MANFASKEDTLAAGFAQTFNFKALLGVNATSIAYSNDDASSTHKLQIDGLSFTVKPGEQRVISGVENWQVLTIGGDAGSTGAYRAMATSSEVPATFFKPYGGTIGTTGITDGAVTDAKLAVGAHVSSGGVVGSPYPTEVVVLDVADGANAANVDFTGLVGKHEIISIQFLFPNATVATDGYEVKNGTSGLSITAGAVLASPLTAGGGLTKYASVLQNTVLASGDTIRLTRTKLGAVSTAARVTLQLMKVA